MLTTKNATVTRRNTASSMGVDLFRFTLPFQSTDYGLRMAAKPAKKWLSRGESIHTSCGNNWTVRRIWIGLIAVFVAVPLCFVAYEGVQTLRILTVVEAERDRWQRPAEIVRALALSDGATVLDLGSGAGYFVLKLSPRVGARGVVLAEVTTSHSRWWNAKSAGEDLRPSAMTISSSIGPKMLTCGGCLSPASLCSDFPLAVS
jgi:hypothetical protein